MRPERVELPTYGFVVHQTLPVFNDFNKIVWSNADKRGQNAATVATYGNRLFCFVIQ